MPARHASRLLAALAAMATALTAVAAQEAASDATTDSGPPAGLTLELNALEGTAAGCRLTFVATNRLGTDIAKAAFEVALFDTAGLVERLMVLDFRDLPHERTRVRQFDLAELDCGGIGRVLINDATACDGDGLAPDACIRGLAAENRTDIAFGA
ncbi:hypothetical protein N1F89_11935 [Aquibium sp. A9E412]|uniref:hypothetical protein n=1 Tax=Aquibium sp. A9E412 TaxID=2976767 RepID=UPI0025AF25D9|nr:hypothetical protein [Aquibium sp. A9E412]MDN2566936.1 hypothetical protein [Aquibium sp. A9E412]